MKKNLYLILLLLFLSLHVLAQTVYVSGIVTNEEKQKLPGVYIVIKGGIEGTTTDLNGAYSLKTKKGDVLAFFIYWI